MPTVPDGAAAEVPRTVAIQVPLAPATTTASQETVTVAAARDADCAGPAVRARHAPPRTAALMKDAMMRLGCRGCRVGRVMVLSWVGTPDASERIESDETAS